jgi:hypothetical protein
MADIRNQIKGTTAASTELKNSVSSLIPGFGVFGQVGQKITGVTQGVGGLTRSFGLLKAAIISTGIGALIVAIGTLITYLTTTQSGMDKLAAVMKPLQAIFQRFIGVVQQLGEYLSNGLTKAIEDPIGALRELGNVLLENVINRFKAFSVVGQAIVKILQGDLKQGFKELTDGSIQFATGVANATDKIAAAAQATQKWVKDGIDAGTQLLNLQKQIEQTEIDLTRNRAKLNQQYQEAKEIAQDTTKSEAERLKAAKEAQNAQNELLNQEQAFLDLKINCN